MGRRSQLQPLPALTQVGSALVLLSSSSVPQGLALESVMETEHSRLQEVLTQLAFSFSCCLNECPLNYIFQNKRFPRTGGIFILVQKRKMERGSMFR